MRDIHDHYFHQAKREGYRSRAAYKLIEIDDRKKVLATRDRVLDCGAAPGSWLQVAARRVGEAGVVVGIDLKPIDPNFREDNIVTIQGDFTKTEAPELLKAAGVNDPTGRFNVVLSDMAPGTTGDPRRDHFRSAQLCETLLGQLPALLAPGGNLVMKIFEGEQYPDVLRRAEQVFSKVKGFKPKASRSESVEMFIVAHDFKPDAAHREEEHAASVTPPRPKPSAGWAS